MRRWSVVGIGLWIGCSGHEEAVVDRAGCTELRAHVVELRLTSVGSGVISTADRQSHRDSLTAALGDRYLDMCLQRYSVAQLTCAKGALTEDALTDCLTKRVK